MFQFDALFWICLSCYRFFFSSLLIWSYFVLVSNQMIMHIYLALHFLRKERYRQINGVNLFNKILICMLSTNSKVFILLEKIKSKAHGSQLINFALKEEILFQGRKDVDFNRLKITGCLISFFPEDIVVVHWFFSPIKSVYLILLLNKLTER